MAFKAKLDLSVAESSVGQKTAKIRGVDSGKLFGVNKINAAADDDEVTSSGKVHYVFNNKVIAEKVVDDEKLNGATEKALSFKLIPQGDNTAYLESATVKFSVSGATLGTGTQDAVLEMDGVEVAYATPSSTGTTLFDLGNSKKAIKNGGSNLVVVLKNVALGTTDTGSITTEIQVNKKDPGSDGIEWSDYGTDGTNGVAISWINIGPSKPATFFANTLVK